MAKAPFSIFTRKGSDKRTVFCVRFFNHDGSVIKTATLREARSHTAAGRLAEKMLQSGIISESENPDALTFLRGFWKRDSPYIRGRAIRGQVLSDRYIETSNYLFEKHLSRYLTNKKIFDLTPAYVEKIILKMSKEGAGARTVNTVLQSLRVPYGYFCRQHRIPNALGSIEKARERPKERGILSAEELGRIIALKDEPPRVVAAVLLGALAGLRLGECRGLQHGDIDDEAGVIHVQHNFVDTKEGLKAPKWGSSRTVYLSDPLIDAIKVCNETRPDIRGPFVLWNERTPASPIPAKTIVNGFHRLLRRIGIDDAERRRRNLCFHGLRHTFVSLSRAGGVPDFVVQKMVGHSTMEMTDRYSHASILDFTKAREAMEAAVQPTKADPQAANK